MTKEEALEVIEKAEQELKLVVSKFSDAPQKISEEKLKKTLDQILDELVVVGIILIPDSEDWKRLHRVEMRLKVIKRILIRNNI